LLSIVSQSAAWFDVMHLKLGDAPAKLAAPPIPLQYLSVQSPIGFRIESQSAS